MKLLLMILFLFITDLRAEKLLSTEIEKVNGAVEVFDEYGEIQWPWQLTRMSLRVEGGVGLNIPRAVNLQLIPQIEFFFHRKKSKDSSP